VSPSGHAQRSRPRPVPAPRRLGPRQRRPPRERPAGRRHRPRDSGRRGRHHHLPRHRHRRRLRRPALSAPFRAVLLDWRGTLVATLTDEQWAAEALRRLGRDDDPAALAVLLASAADRLDGPGVDSDADLHRRTYLGGLADLGLDEQLALTLYAVESDLSLNPFADDAPATLRRLRDAGLRLAVVSDIHVDVRPAFAAAGLAGVVDVFTLSFELGAQKPDPRVFTTTLDALGVQPHEALMVGDRSRPDGAAVECGVPTLLLPPLTAPHDRRLHHVLALCGG
jgi:FMN phosphatase YigB (HAD superfamily)